MKKTDGRLRFILSALHGNAMLKRPGHTDLAGPESIASVQLPTLPAFAAKSDLSDAFFHWESPEWLWDYCGLPPVMSDELGVGQRQRGTLVMEVFLWMLAGHR